MLDYEGGSIEKALERDGEIVVSTAGLSMYPMLRNKQDVVVIKKAEGRLKKHDVPLYRTDSGKLLLHRIIKVTDNGYLIRGDNLLNTETDVTDNNIIGVLKCFYRGGKFVDCEKSLKYKIYVFWISINYPLRYFWKKTVRPFLNNHK